MPRWLLTRRTHPRKQEQAGEGARASRKQAPRCNHALCREAAALRRLECRGTR
eukprot:COSAG03_NODE_16124_length_411_cov_0.826923_1_plen_52_part_01